MAALQCDLCGGKLMGRPGGIFECDSCGMQYDTAWAKEKIQEIKGTVRVEGTVQVTGTVKVETPVRIEGNVTLDSLLKRIRICLLEQQFGKVEELAEQALNIDPECGEIYLCQYLAELGMQNLDMLLAFPAFVLKYCLPNRPLWSKAVSYGCNGLQQKLDAAIVRAQMEVRTMPDGWSWRTAALVEEALNADPNCGEAYLFRLMKNHRVESLDELSACSAETLENIQKDPDWEMSLKLYTPPVGKKLTERMAEAVEQSRIREKQKENWIDLLKARHNQIRPLQQLLWTGDGYILALKSDGTVLVTHDGTHGWLGPVRSWKGIKRIRVCKNRYVVGLLWDGTMVGAFRNWKTEQRLRQIKQWTDIVEFDCYDERDGEEICFGVMKNGKLLSSPEGNDKTGNDINETVYALGTNYTNLKQLVAYCDPIWRSKVAYAIGVKRDGNLVGPSTKDIREEAQKHLDSLKLYRWKNVKAIRKYLGITTEALLQDGTLWDLLENKNKSFGSQYLDFDLRGDCSSGHWDKSASNHNEDVVAVTDKYPQIHIQFDGKIIVGEKPIQSAVREWDNIVISSVSWNIPEKTFVIAGVQEDGQVLAAWSEKYGNKLSVAGWKLFERFDAFWNEQSAMIRKLDGQRRKQEIDTLESERKALTEELTSLHGIFTGWRRKTINTRLSQIEAELKELK